MRFIHQAKCGKQRSSSDSDSTKLPRLKKKQSACVALQETTKGKWERKALLKGEKKK